MESLICNEPAEKAPFLFSKRTIENLTEAERHGEYTLERLKEQRPEAIKEIIRLRGQLVGMLRIAKIVGVHHRTVAAVDAAYPQEIDRERQRRVHQLQTAAEKLVEQVNDSPENVPWNVKCLAASQLIDKAILLEGGVIARTEHTERIDIFAHFQAFVANLQKEVKGPTNSIDIAGCNVGAEMGAQRGKVSAISDSAEGAIALPPNEALTSEREV